MNPTRSSSLRCWCCHSLSPSDHQRQQGKKIKKIISRPKNCRVIRQNASAHPKGGRAVHHRRMVLIEDDTLRLDTVCQPLQVRHRSALSLPLFSLRSLHKKKSQSIKNGKEKVKGCSFSQSELAISFSDLSFPVPLSLVYTNSTTPEPPSLKLWVLPTSPPRSPPRDMHRASRASGK